MIQKCAVLLTIQRTFHSKIWQQVPSNICTIDNTAYIPQQDMTTRTI